MEQIVLFPTYLYKVKHEEDSWCIPCVESEALALEYVRNTNNHMTVNRNVLELPFMQELKGVINKALADYVKLETGSNDIELRVTQSWLNVTEKEGSHFGHKHINSFVSGVVYINASDEDLIVFHPPDRGMNISLLPRGEPDYAHPVNTGDIILFPSNMHHSVPPASRNYRRLSLAFNTFPVGKLGMEESSTALNIKNLS